MSKAYVLESRHVQNGAMTKWKPFDYNPNLEYARNALRATFYVYWERDDREEMKEKWLRMAEDAKTLEVGDVLECDECQWRISLE